MTKRDTLLARYKNLIYEDDAVSIEVIDIEGQIVEANDKITEAKNTIEKTSRKIKELEIHLEEEIQEKARVTFEIAEVEAVLAVSDKWLLLPVTHNDYRLWQQAKAKGVDVITNKWMMETFGISTPTAGLRLTQAERAGLLEKLGPGKFLLRTNVSEGPPPPVDVQRGLEEEIMTADEASTPTAAPEAAPAVEEALEEPEGA